MDKIFELKYRALPLKGGTFCARIPILDREFLRGMRAQLHLSQWEFARDYNIPLPSLQAWEGKKRTPDFESARRLEAIAIYAGAEPVDELTGERITVNELLPVRPDFSRQDYTPGA